MPLRLYDYAASANCLKVRMLLALIRRPYERVPIDIFAGDAQRPGFLDRNPAGQTPVLELDDGECLPESNAILLFLARGTALMPDDPLGHAQVLRWLFFEQDQIVPSIGSARFWQLTGRVAGREDELARRLAAAQGTLALLDHWLAHRRFLVEDAITAADLGLYGYTHVAPEAGVDLEPFEAVRRWHRRIEAQPGFVNDLLPYPPNACRGAGRSVYA